RGPLKKGNGPRRVVHEDRKPPHNRFLLWRRDRGVQSVEHRDSQKKKKMTDNFKPTRGKNVPKEHKIKKRHY
ncbi:hypothetical protein ACTHR4_11135, partial [Neisseria sp. P0004.S009]|uniref:hypothetical protein n=1 Tax=Neisseria sp. P0004.S009 TaxID=3436673 RepID=UPI003F7D68C0